MKICLQPQSHDCLIKAIIGGLKHFSRCGVKGLLDWSADPWLSLIHVLMDTYTGVGLPLSDCRVSCSRQSTSTDCSWATISVGVPTYAGLSQGGL